MQTKKLSSVNQPNTPAETIALIQKCLDDCEHNHGVTILFAAESGSRAWGFSTPNSDYDVRFVYYHPPAWYLSLIPGRDVIEYPISDRLDLVGWDLQKALRLLIAGNPTLIEWLNAPVLYRENAETDLIRRLIPQSKYRRAAFYHYRSLALKVIKTHLSSKPQVALKTYLYAIRAVLLLTWLRENTAGPIAMDLPTLLPAAGVPTKIKQEIDRLLRHRAMPEADRNGAPLPLLDAWLAEQLSLPMPPFCSTPLPNSATDTLVRQAEQIFRHIVLPSASLP
jgi:predicted nucleotidyltransferase